jgi:hypothetical protein
VNRNTAQKQWDETKVLAMSGIVRVMKISLANAYKISKNQFVFKSKFKEI